MRELRPVVAYRDEDGAYDADGERITDFRVFSYPRLSLGLQRRKERPGYDLWGMRKRAEKPMRGKSWKPHFRDRWFRRAHPEWAEWGSPF